MLPSGVITDPPIRAQIAPLAYTPIVSPKLTVVETETPDGAGRVDTFTVPAVVGLPEVRVEFDLIGPTAESLRVVDASGKTLSSVPIGDWDDYFSTTEVRDKDGLDTLEVGITMHPAPAGAVGAGTYRITIFWEPRPTAANLDTIAPTLGAPAPNKPVVVPVPPAPAPTPPPFSATVGLPSPVVTPTGGYPSSTPAGPPTGPTGPSSSPPPGSPPPVLTAPQESGPPTEASPSAALGAGPSAADRGQPTFVGPLPLAPSTADGGFFARGSAPIIPTGSDGLAGEETAMSRPAILGGADRLEVPGPEFVAPAPPTVAIGPERPFNEGCPASDSREAGRSTEDGPAAEGLAFLPRLATLAKPATAISARPLDSLARPRTPGRPRLVPIALAGSIFLILGLAGPGFVEGFASRQILAGRERRGSDRKGPR